MVEATSLPHMVDEWKRQEADGQANRDKNGGASMDIYDLKISKGILNNCSASFPVAHIK